MCKRDIGWTIPIHGLDSVCVCTLEVQKEDECLVLGYNGQLQIKR